jgi:site-specific recombinase XerD
MVKIDSNGAREKLEFRRDPYWQRIAPGLYVGYRVSEKGGDGTWRARWRDDNGRQQYRTIEPSEFTQDTTGQDTKFRQAEKIARAWQAALAEGVTPKRLTLADAVAEYLKDKRRDRKARALRAADSAEAALARHVLADPVAGVFLDKLRSDMLTAWLDRRVSPKNPEDPDSVRAAQSTANRERARLVAVLSWAYKERLIASDAPWRGLRKFADTHARREFIPSQEQSEALLAAGTPEVSRVARFLDITGCRPGEAFKATAAAFDEAGGTLTIDTDTKTGRRVVPLSTEGIRYLASLAAGKIGKALLLTRDDGAAWDSAEYAKRFRLARERAGLTSEFVPYSFRHRWITLAIGHMEIGTVALAAGTSVEMIERHYAKLQPSRMRAALDRLESERTETKTP